MSLMSRMQFCTSKTSVFVPKHFSQLACGHRNFQPRTIVRSGNGVPAGGEAQETISIWPTSLEIPMKLYYVIEAGDVLAQFALVDAAYSGDWSRIGVITTETELALQSFVWGVAIAHSVTSVIAMKAASDNGDNVAIAGLKGFWFGILGLWEVLYKISKSSGDVKSTK